MRKMNQPARGKSHASRGDPVFSPGSRLPRRLKERTLCLKIRQPWLFRCARFAGRPDLAMDRRMATSFDGRILAAAVAGLATGLAVPAFGGEGIAVTCTNPVSGASWQIVIDYRQSTVDTYPAKVSRAAISWFDPRDGGSYTLDRGSGALTATAASSTGGYFRHSRCRLGKSR
jgi:hypothetical protein